MVEEGSVGVGLADVESQKEMTAGTRMLAASIGKSFAATAVLSLESEGLLSQSDRVSKFLSDRPWFSRLPNHDKMTIRDLLRHTAGLPDHVHTEGFGAAMAKHVQSGSSAMSPEAAIVFVCDMDALFEAGDGWSYSDSGYLLLGLVIESVAGDSYYEVIAERFLTPLALAGHPPVEPPQRSPALRLDIRSRRTHSDCPRGRWMRMACCSGIRQLSGREADFPQRRVILPLGDKPSLKAQCYQRPMSIGYSTP